MMGRVRGLSAESAQASCFQRKVNNEFIASRDVLEIVDGSILQLKLRNRLAQFLVLECALFANDRMSFCVPLRP